MKRNLVLAALMSLFVLAIGVSAQKTADFSGTWTLDASKSSPAETMLESETIKATQTATDIKVERTRKMKPAPDGAPAGGGGRGMGGGMGGPQDYGIGTPIKVTRTTPNGDIEISMSAKIDGSKLTLSSATPQGSRDETWTLNSDGTLTTTSTGRGGTTTTRTYKKG